MDDAEKRKKKKKNRERLRLGSWRLEGGGKPRWRVVRVDSSDQIRPIKKRARLVSRL
jgi:hypothetical protein